MNAAAIKKAAKIQAQSIKDAQNFVFKNLDPAVVNREALAADRQQLLNQLAFQAEVDPALAAVRGQASQKLLESLQGAGTGAAQDIAAQATQEALAGGPAITDLKNKLIDAAQQELALGATLPPDVQAELVRTGLEKSGMVMGAATPQGLGGGLIRRELGLGAIKLQADRQARAAALAGTASQLDASRQQILQSLFPNLQAKDINTQQQVTQALQAQNALMPQAGLSGSDIANIWLARVGATSNLTQQLGNVNANAAYGTAQAWAPAVSQGIQSFGQALPGAYQTVKGWFSPSQPSWTQSSTV